MMGKPGAGHPGCVEKLHGGGFEQWLLANYNQCNILTVNVIDEACYCMSDFLVVSICLSCFSCSNSNQKILG